MPERWLLLYDVPNKCWILVLRCTWYISSFAHFTSALRCLVSFLFSLSNLIDPPSSFLFPPGFRCRCSGFPRHGLWWVVQVVCFAIQTLLGEYICVRRELQELPMMGATTVV